MNMIAKSKKQFVDTVKDDGYILLSEEAIKAEANSYHVFSNKNNSIINSSSASNNTGSSSSNTQIENVDKTKLTKEILSIAIGFTPIGPAKDFIDLILGKDILTGEEVSRGILLACLIIPGGVDSVLKSGVKNADEAVKILEKCTDADKKVVENLVKEGLSNNILKEVSELGTNKIHHILQDKHLWGNVVSDANDWGQVSKVISKVMQEGIEQPYKSVFSKTLEVNGHVVEVTYAKLSDGTIKISDAWVRS